MTTTHAADYAARLGLAFTPSAYQAKIFDFIAHGEGNGLAEAVAGSGKTTTVVAGAGLISTPGLFLAFNRSIADNLAEKLAGTRMTSSTIHRHGFAAIRFNCDRVKVDGKKYAKMLDKIQDAAIHTMTSAERDAVKADGFPRAEILKLVNLARLDVLDAEGLDFTGDMFQLAAKHSIDWAPELDSFVAKAVRSLMRQGAKALASIDFTDMVWVPVVRSFRPKRYDWIFVDECQDISAAARHLIHASTGRDGRILFVGDRRQAVYGFAGADSESFAKIIEEFACTVLPLSVCYRCPTSVLDRARAYCPQIEARPGATEGTVKPCTKAGLVDEARDGDMVLCRRTAPLIGLCFELIAGGKPACVRGRAIGENLISTARKAAKGRPWAQFPEGLDAWLDKEQAKVRRRYKDADRAEERCEQLADQAECVRVVYARSDAGSINELAEAIEEIFSDDRESITLSTIHRAKGLEADRVAILEHESLGLARAGAREWQAEQERNLAYVAITRAKSVLFEVVPALADASEPAKAEAPAKAAEPKTGPRFVTAADMMSPVARQCFESYLAAR